MINILGRDIDLLLLSPEDFKYEAEIKGMWEDGLQGFFNQKTSQIFVNGGLGKEQQQRVIIHELGHVLFDVSGLNYLLSDKQEDAVCTLIENLMPLMQELK